MAILLNRVSFVQGGRSIVAQSIDICVNDGNALNVVNKLHTHGSHLLNTRRLRPPIFCTN